MSIAAVSAQFGVARAVNTQVSYALPQNVNAGDLIVVCGQFYDTGFLTPAASDLTKASGTATIGTPTLDLSDERSTSGVCGFGIWSVIVTGGGSLTLTLAPGGTYVTMEVGVFTGNWGTQRVEASNKGYSTADGETSHPSGNASSAGAALFIGTLAIDKNSTDTITQDGAFTLIAEEETGTTYQVGGASYRIVSGATTDSSDYTSTGNNGGWLSGLVVYRESRITERIGTGGQTTSPTVTVTKPTGTVDGDLIAVAFSTDFADSVTPPAGWSKHVDYAFTGDQRLTLFVKIASGEGSSWNFTTPGNVTTWAAQAWNGVQNTLDVTVVTQSNTAASPPNLTIAGITTTTPGDLVLYLATYDGGGSGAQTVTDPSGFVQGYNQYVAGSGFMYIAWQEKFVAGSTGSVAAVLANQTESNVSGVALVALKPSVVSAGFPGLTATITRNKGV